MTLYIEVIDINSNFWTGTKILLVIFDTYIFKNDNDTKTWIYSLLSF